MRKTEGKSTDNEYRTISVVDDLIVYDRKADGIRDYLSYDKELFDILRLNCMTPDRQHDFIRFSLNSNKDKIYLHELAIGCYDGVVKEESFKTDLEKRRIEISDSHGVSPANMTVDHCDSNHRNNTKYNLSWMTRFENAKKSNITSRFKIPAYLIPAYCDGMYRIRFSHEIEQDVIHSILERFNILSARIQMGSTVGRVNNIKVLPDSDCRDTTCFLCNTPGELIDCLNSLSYLEFEYADSQKDKSGWKNKDEDCFTANALASIREQRKITVSPEELFDKWKEQHIH